MCWPRLVFILVAWPMGQNAKEAFKEEMLKKLQAVRKKLEQEMAEISKPVVESVESEIAEKEPQAVVDPTKASDISVLIKDVEITASSTPVVQGADDLRDFLLD